MRFTSRHEILATARSAQLSISSPEAFWRNNYLNTLSNIGHRQASPAGHQPNTPVWIHFRGSWWVYWNILDAQWRALHGLGFWDRPDAEYIDID